MGKLTKFKQTTSDTFVLEFDRRVKEWCAVFEPGVPEQLDLKCIGLHNNHGSGFDKGGANIVLKVAPKFEAQINEYSVVLKIYFERNAILKILVWLGLTIREDHSGPYYMEIVRQPPVWLKEKFDFESKNGYSILGRGSLEVKAKPRKSSTVITYSGVPDVTLIASQDVSSLSRQIGEIEELLIASKIIRAIWDGEVQDSPTLKSYSDFVCQPFENKLNQIRRGEFPVSCQGIRDLFLHGSLAFEGFQARAVNAFNHCPQFPDLIAYTHATAEVYVQSLAKWVLCDPWAGFVLATPEGKLVSAEEVARQSDHLAAIPLVDQILQYHTGSDKTTSQVSRRPIEVDVCKYTFTDVGHVPAYTSYFRYIEYAMPKLAKV
jgi:hypothetical protein